MIVVFVLVRVPLVAMGVGVGWQSGIGGRWRHAEPMYFQLQVETLDTECRTHWNWDI